MAGRRETAKPKDVRGRMKVLPEVYNAKKAFYDRALSWWKNEKWWLTDTCLDWQDTFNRLMEMQDVTQIISA